MDGELYVWARQRQIERDLAQLDLLTEAKQLATQDSSAERQSAPSRVPNLLWNLAISGLSALGVLHHSA
jgi:hypothetical protein